MGHKHVTTMIYLVYETDAWYSTESMELRGAFHSLHTAINEVIVNNEFNYDKIAEERQIDKDNMTTDIFVGTIEGIIRDELTQHRQTSFEQFNYIIDAVDEDHWI